MNLGENVGKKTIKHGSLFLILLLFPKSIWAGSFSVISHFKTAYFRPKFAFATNTIYGTTSWYIYQMKTDGSGYDAWGFDIESHIQAGVILNEGRFYGCASTGGTTGRGTIFSLKMDGSDLQILREFAGPDGEHPVGELLILKNQIYGTTAFGGTFDAGSIFRMNLDGSEFITLKSFKTNESYRPYGSLTYVDGRLYGTTILGGTSNAGTIYSIGTNGSVFTLLKQFDGTNGIYPRYNLAFAAGWLYGVTTGNGSSGIIYKIGTNGGGYQVIKAFSPLTSGANADGDTPASGLSISGNTLFGCTSKGGNFGNGVVFALHTDGSGYAKLHDFSALSSLGTNSDGAVPQAALALCGDTLYGATFYGGTNAAANGRSGTLFALRIAPEIQMDDGNFGVSSNGFGFNVTGYSNQSVVLETSYDLAAPFWVALKTNTISTGPVYFSDPFWTNYSRRFYRIRTE